MLTEQFNNALPKMGFAPKANADKSVRWGRFLRFSVLFFSCFSLPLPISSQRVPPEFGRDIKVSFQNFDELVAYSDWLTRSNQRVLSQSLLSDLLAFADAHPAPQNLIQAHHAYGRYYRYYLELDSASLHGDKMLEIVEQELGFLFVKN